MKKIIKYINLSIFVSGIIVFIIVQKTAIAEDERKESEVTVLVPQIGITIPEELVPLYKELMDNPAKLEENPKIIKDFPLQIQRTLMDKLLVPEERRDEIGLVFAKAVREIWGGNRPSEHSRMLIELVKLHSPFSESVAEKECYLVREEGEGILLALAFVSLDTKVVKILYAADLGR